MSGLEFAIDRTPARQGAPGQPQPAAFPPPLASTFRLKPWRSTPPTVTGYVSLSAALRGNAANVFLDAGHPFSYTDGQAT